MPEPVERETAHPAGGQDHIMTGAKPRADHVGLIYLNIQLLERNHRENSEDEKGGRTQGGRHGRLQCPRRADRALKG
jgi:hypothetical protein